MRLLLPLCAVSVLIASLVVAQRGAAPVPDDPLPEIASGPLVPFSKLVGMWNGKSSGKFGEAHVEKRYEVLFGGTYLEATTRTVRKKEILEDVGIFSFDKERETHLLREFHSGGQVNRYTIDISPDGETYVFETESIENASAPRLRVRNTITFVNDDQIRESYCLAVGKEEYEVCAESTLYRRR